MSDRERWIVYPLLFLALGVSLRDKFTRSIDGLMFLNGKSMQMDLQRGVIRAQELDVNRIRCGKLRVEAGPKRPLVVLQGASVPTKGDVSRLSGAISVYGQDGKEIIVLRANHALKGKFIRKSRPGDSDKMVFNVQEVQEEGGMIEVFDGQKLLSLVLAHPVGESGLFAKNRQGQLVRLSRVIPRQPSKKPASQAPGGSTRPNVPRTQPGRAAPAPAPATTPKAT